MWKNLSKSVRSAAASGLKNSTRSVKSIRVMNVIRPVVAMTLTVDATVPTNLYTGPVGVAFTLDAGEEMEEEGGRTRRR